ncbi:hypothetical protein PTE30175_03724 [Pandoraea terrae]|uniref:Transmembrane protein n=1 Tax=Pandoraea terrae TaxID=1537710 RepID=A0A5E4XE12_9BURK|nr:hypothetical protein [Pandoraea terrae]VVE34400.1 hypothetical protein PTE30175_03724 [Pandoraea terrae]
MQRRLAHRVVIGATTCAAPFRKRWRLGAALGALGASAPAVALAADTLPGAASSALAAATAAAPVVLPRPLIVSIFVGMTIVLFASLLLIVKTLRRQGWSLADALSEEASLPPGTPTPAAGQAPPLVASTSRLIALVGTVILGTFFSGIGYYVVWQLCNGRDLDAANGAWAFFVSGATLFAPYGVNKLAKIFQAG